MSASTATRNARWTSVVVSEDDCLPYVAICVDLAGAGCFWTCANGCATTSSPSPSLSLSLSWSPALVVAITTGAGLDTGLVFMS